MMYTVAELVELARVYMAATGTTASRLSKLAANNNRLFERLSEGYDCHADMVERASGWFDEHWPDDLEWPKGVTRRAGPANGHDDL
jgi:hypothetical protein